MIKLFSPNTKMSGFIRAFFSSLDSVIRSDIIKVSYEMKTHTYINIFLYVQILIARNVVLIFMTLLFF